MKKIVAAVLLMVALLWGGTLASAYEIAPEPEKLPEPNVNVVDIVKPFRICGDSSTTFTVKLYNSGYFNGMGYLYLYIDGSLKASQFVEIYPSELLSVDFKIRTPHSGTHTVTAKYVGRVSTSTRTETFEVNDIDCDGWLNEIELQQYTDPENPDTDGDGVLDPDDMDPLSNLTMEIDVFMIRGLDALPNSTLGFRIYGKAIASVEEKNFSKTFYLAPNQSSFEKYLPAWKSPLNNIQDQAIASLTIDIPDYWDSVTVTFRTSLVLKDGSEIPLDISPQQGKQEAVMYFNVLKGTWWGDDSPNDHNVRYGYGHLSGAGDGSGSYGEGAGSYTEPFSKYYGDLEALGYNLSVVNITSVRGWDGLDEIDYLSAKGPVRVLKPAEVVEFTLKFPDGRIERVLLINKHGARVVPFKPPKAPPGVKADAPLDDHFKAELEKLKNGSFLVKSKFLTETLPVSNTVRVYTVDSPDENDAEIWFLIRLIDGDGDGIPYYREFGLNYDLEQNGYPKRFDPRKNDMYGDYDDDGVPNSVELFIGKDPAKPDVLGINLTVAVGWDATPQELSQILKGFQRASQVVYDYTDGYAMIAEVNITNNVPPDSEEWGKYMVRIRPESYGELVTHGQSFGYWKWVENSTFRTLCYIELFKRFGNDAPDQYYRGTAHELAHFVFGVGDEYGAPFQWDPKNNGTLQDFYYLDLAKILERDYHISGFDWLHTVMGRNWKGEELSTSGHPTLKSDYDWFYNELLEYDRKVREATNNTYGLIEVIRLHGGPRFTSILRIMPSHWYENYTLDGIPENMTSAWKVVFHLLAKGHTAGDWFYSYDAGLYLDLDFDGSPDQDLPSGYTPKIGPYTGVGYYMIARWG